MFHKPQLLVQEQDVRTMLPVVVPRKHDILLGRGKTRNDHPGNQRFRCIIHLNIPRYADASSSSFQHKKNKTKIIRSIVDDLRREGCRFLKQDEDSGVWSDVSSDREAKRKVGHALRDASAEMYECLNQEDLDKSSLYLPETEDERLLFLPIGDIDLSILDDVPTGIQWDTQDCHQEQPPTRAELLEPAYEDEDDWSDISFLSEF